MSEIKLERGVWQIDESKPLGPAGGFGEVFRGSGKNGDVAIKRLKINASAAAHREMNIGKVLASRTLEHVVPVLDFGKDADSDRYYLVMPVCDRSLQDDLNQKGKLDWQEAKTATLDIIAGLMEVGDLVHRDLKPGNVLWYEARWRIADFGIAKFVEDSTSDNTLRDSLTAWYGAPEQWLGKAPTRATDVYALGCLLHALINGSPPFTGSQDAVREAHLHISPPDLIGVDPRLQGLVQTMLRKSPSSRPILERCASVIRGIEDKPLTPRNQGLAEAGSAIAQKAAADEAKRHLAETAKQERKEASYEAIKDLQGIVRRLFDEVEASSEVVRRQPQFITLGPATLTFQQPVVLTPDQAPDRYQTGWDVLAASAISIKAAIERVAMHHPSEYTFPATLVFARTGKDSEYRWREISFWSWASSTPNDQQPSALSPIDTNFYLALSNVTGGWQTAHGPLTIDAEDEDGFHVRWLRLFTKAATGKLRPSNQMPLPPNFFD